MKKRHFIVMFLMLFVMWINSSYAAEDDLTKKVVSIVYDDSGSMQTNNNYCYSDYALQILTASMSKNDELNIVKMSDFYTNNEIDLTTQTQKQNYINEIRMYEHIGGTPFESVDTAKNWLIEKSKIYGDTADYWLVVITDGEFAGVPQPVNDYFDNVNAAFNNLNYEFVLLNIGGYAGSTFKNAINNSANSNVVDASDRESIYNSLLQIANMINNGASDKIVTAERNGDKKIKVYSKYPLKKMMILTQNTNNKVLKVSKDGSNLKNENYDVGYDVENLQGSLTQVIDPNKEYLNVGSYEIEFSENVDLNTVTFLCEVLVECKISIVDEDDKVLNNAQLNFLTSDKVIKVKCELFNVVDGSKLDISGSENDIAIQLVNDKNKYNLVYDKSKNAYYTDVTLIGENNNIYAIAEAKDLFRIKSNVVFIDTVAGKANIEKYENAMVKIEVPYSSSKDFEKVGQFAFSFVEETEYNVAEDFELQVIDLPDGIRFEYGGKEYKNNEKIPMVKEFGKEYILNLLVNRDYKEVEDATITLKIISKDNSIYWSSNGVDEEYVVLTPKAYPVKILNKEHKTTIDVQNEKLNLSVVKVADESNILSIVGNVDIKDIKDIKTNSSSSSGFTYKVKKDENSNSLQIEFKPNILALFKDKTIEVKLDVVLNNEKESASYSENITLANIDVLGILMPYIIMAAGLIVVIGYVSKKKFNKKAQITITENGERVSYALKPNISTVLIPYVGHKTKIGMIEFRAGKNSDIIYSGKGLDILKINGENFEDYKENNNFNIEKIIMKKDLSNITINAFDVEQKYEYLSKEVDAGSYSDDYVDDSMTDYESDSYSDSDYMDSDQF